MKIVIVEDEEILIKVLKEKFESADFQVFTAMDGEAGLKIIQDNKPDIVLLDLLLPKKDGFSVLSELKDDPNVSGIPVIALSNLGQNGDIEKAKQLGAVDYLVKTQHPINEVVEKVREYLMSKGK